LSKLNIANLGEWLDDMFLELYFLFIGLWLLVVDPIV